MKTGMVLEGGAMRGLYTAGVLDVLMENGVYTDGTVGVSAGAAFGCNYKSRQIGRSLRYNCRYCRDPRYISLRSLIRTGDLYNAQFCYYEIPEKLDPFDTAAFAASPMEFYVVATDVTTGKPAYHLCRDGGRDDIEWMRASASMPLVSRVVEIGGGLYLDGGISDSIPLEWFRSIGYKKNIVVLTRKEEYRKKKTSLMGAIRLSLKKYPHLCEAMEMRHEMYNRQLDYVGEQKKAGNTLVLAPSRTPEVKRTERDPEKLRALYALGRSDAEARLGEIREFLSE